MFKLYGHQLEEPPVVPLLVSDLSILSLSIMAIASTVASSPPVHPEQADLIFSSISFRVESGPSIPQRYDEEDDIPPGSAVPAGNGGEGVGVGLGLGDTPEQELAQLKQLWQQ